MVVPALHHARIVLDELEPVSTWPCAIFVSKPLGLQILPPLFIISARLLYFGFSGMLRGKKKEWKNERTNERTKERKKERKKGRKNDHSRKWPRQGQKKNNQPSQIWVQMYVLIHQRYFPRFVTLHCFCSSTPDSLLSVYDVTSCGVRFLLHRLPAQHPLLHLRISNLTSSRWATFKTHVARWPRPRSSWKRRRRSPCRSASSPSTWTAWTPTSWGARPTSSGTPSWGWRQRSTTWRRGKRGRTTM